MKNYLEYEQKISCDINDFLQNIEKRCLWIVNSNSKNIQDIITQIQTDYLFTDLFYNVQDETDLLFLLRQQKNPKKKPPEYDAFLNPIWNISFSKILSASMNLFRNDFVSITDQIIREIKNINLSKVCILLDCSGKPNNRLFSAIHAICTETTLESKIILIGEEHNCNSSLLKSANYLQILTWEFPADYFKTLFPNLDEIHIRALRIAANDNIKEMRELYAYLNDKIKLEINTNELLQDILESGLRQSFNANDLKIFGIAAHLVDQFSSSELEGIIIDEMKNNIIAEEIENALFAGIEKGLIQELPKDAYKFIISIVKNALQNLYNRQDRKIHLAIESYLSKKRPFAYDLRYFHLNQANSKKIDHIITICFFNKLHFGKAMDKKTETRFIDLYGKSVACSILKAYRLIDQGDFHGALTQISGFDSNVNPVLDSEVKYLEAYLLWKTLDKNNVYKLLTNKFNEIINSDCELEIKIFTKLLQLSVLSNESDHLSDNAVTPTQLFHEIGNLLIPLDNIDAQFLYHVLQRKSNCALSRVAAISRVRAAFEYFSHSKEFYPAEYLYAGTNYTALLIQSVTTGNQSPILKEKEEIYNSRDAFEVAKKLKTELIDLPKIKTYLENNYLIAKTFYSDEAISKKKLVEFEQMIRGVSTDSYIMFYMNLGTFYAILNDYDESVRCWELAKSANNGHDAYFNYILDNNFFVLSLLQGNKEVIPPNTIPMLVSSDVEILAYFNKRNSMLNSLKTKSIKFQSYQDAETFFESEFSQIYNHMQLKMWSKPFILSDVQFWSEN